MQRTASRSESLGPFHMHPGHAFEGFELAEPSTATPMLVARCECGEVLDVAEARFACCPECAGGGCLRCGDTGRIVDHAALEWRPAPNAISALSPQHRP
jgi:hypothetical protein